MHTSWICCLDRGGEPAPRREFPGDDRPDRAAGRDDVGEEIRANTRLFNVALERMILRHPEQWWWVHRRWKEWPARKKRRA